MSTSVVVSAVFFVVLIMMIGCAISYVGLERETARAKGSRERER